LDVIAGLQKEQIPVNVTAMMTWEQMRIAAEATHGFDNSYISLFWARSLDSRDARMTTEDKLVGVDHDINSHPSKIVRATLDLINDNGWINPKIIIGSIRSVRQAGEALASGAHIVTITPNVLEAMLTDAMTSKTVIDFDQAWKDMGK
jgi:transaldolase